MAFGDWLNDRTGHRRFVALWRNRTLPNGPGWWFASGSVLLWLLVVEVVTGLLLMATYSPSMTTAWASVHYIESSSCGTFLRGLHHYTSHALIILFLVHVARVVISGVFRAPRELIWFSGLLMIPLILVWAVTGNPLSGTQKGMAQIEVEGNIIGSTPVAGPILQRILIGGDEVGHLTLTHLYFLHVGLLPLTALVLLALHISQVYRHGLAPVEHSPAKDAAVPGAVPGAAPMPYWPHQTVRNMLVLLVVLVAIAMLAGQGAPLDMPADSELPHSPRPEWYFRGLFELRRHFTAQWEFIATIVLPLAVLLFFLALPFVDRRLWPRAARLFRAAVVLGGLGGWGYLTWISYARDAHDQAFLADAARGRELAARARLLADSQGIPPEGAIALLQNDPKTQGPLLFARHCASCHPWNGPNRAPQVQTVAAEEISAPNLFGLATPEWIAGFLDPAKIASQHYFGNTKFRDGDMANKAAELFADLDETAAAARREEIALAARALAAEAQLPSLKDADQRDAAQIEAGKQLIVGDLACTDCHKFHEHGSLGSAPDLTGYLSREWLLGMIADPQGQRFYPGERNDRMPAFARDATREEHNTLSRRELELLVDWLRGTWFEPPR